VEFLRSSDRTLIAREFFETDPVTCARSLLGVTLVHGRCRGRIVETEAYAEFGDEACHTWMRPSARKFVADCPAGAAYIYFNYGVHWMFNVLVKGDSNGFVLVRALEPTSGIGLMRQRRGKDDPEQLCSGPGKLTQALGIDNESHGKDLCAARSRIRLLPTDGEFEIEADTRIGISSAQDLPWRFLVRGSRYVSRPKQKNRSGRI